MNISAAFRSILHFSVMTKAFKDELLLSDLHTYSLVFMSSDRMYVPVETWSQHIKAPFIPSVYHTQSLPYLEIHAFHSTGSVTTAVRHKWQSTFKSNYNASDPKNASIL